MSQPDIRLGLIGAGTIGKMHLLSLAALRESNLIDLEISAICDIDSSTLSNAAGLFEVSSTYTDYQEMIDNENLNVIYVCTPTNKHRDMVKAAAKAGKAVFCEKPLAHSGPQAQDLYMIAKSNGIKAAVGLVLRYDQFLVQAKNLLDTHDFGKPMLAHIRDDQRFPIDYIYASKWRMDRSIAGGGTLIEHSIHDIDVLQWFFGPVEHVYATVNNFSGMDVEDHASLILTHKEGSVSTLDSVWHWVERPNERRFEFFFEKGYLGIKLESDKKYVEYQLQGERPVKLWAESVNPTLIEHLGLKEKELSPEAIETLTMVGSERYAALSYSFLKSVIEDTRVVPSFKEGVSAHRIVDAAYESADKSSKISLS
ncbi:MAG: hypothetical protein BAJATHORv1_10386 [Candidatus Thorarchaeota archaeon]|nr:MAG: hypothetical protein BAJATHORv1_10386 [Candidatus Thorarchaeota archaeon]